ncbi:MAG: hypothetical protein H0U34_00645 [Sphingomonas sp.]|nr:hypothetical protein [Sphingomonas sp.]
MIRLVLAMICALGLAFSPVAANAAPAAGSGMPGCIMDGDMPDMAADHSKMDCCTPACQAPSSSAATLSKSISAALLAPAKSRKLTWGSPKDLVAFLVSALDPPPRA